MKSKHLMVSSIILLTITTLAYSHNMGWIAPDNVKAIKNPIQADTTSIERGAKTYKEKCVICHGEKGDGKGVVGANLTVKPSNFTDKEMMDEMTDGEIFWKISTGKGPMPSWKDKLKESEIWDLVNHIRKFSVPEKK
ncbi:MAG: cytochrome c [Candidatus Schekmanbacteria bacterium]|nr:cytochrome c [Candidatus Schekmanbacteria bacterium]